MNLPPGVHGARRKRLATVLQEALLLPEAEWPQRVRSVRNRPTDEQEQRMEQLKNRRDRVAEGCNSILAWLLPGRRWNGSRESRSGWSILMRWQRQLLGFRRSVYSRQRPR